METKLDSYHLPVTGGNILRFAFPTIVMTVFNTFYTMVDGLFVSNLIGVEALSAINLTAPAIALITAVSGMLATGGGAVGNGNGGGTAAEIPKRTPLSSAVMSDIFSSVSANRLLQQRLVPVAQGIPGLDHPPLRGQEIFQLLLLAESAG